MRKNIYAVIVVYNKNCDESITYNCLKDVNGINIILCDNSDPGFNNKNKLNPDDKIYIDMQGNKGLSKAYNAAISTIKDYEGYVCLFDDDTTVTSNYFDELKSLIDNNKSDIYLPIVSNSKGIMSPVQFRKYHIRRFDNISNIKYEYLAGINSGMAINLALFKNYQYDENMFLDFIDYKFILDMRNRDAKLHVMNAEIIQSFSIETNDITSAKKRFKIKKKDLRYFYKDGLLLRLYYFYLITRLKLGLLLRYKSLSILLW